jgi:hypothetical protein
MLKKFGLESQDLKEALMIMLDMCGDQTVIDRISGIYSDYFKALQDRGFTREEALQLLAKMPVGNLQK